MKRFLIFVAVLAMAGVAATAVRAETAPMTEAHIDRIRSHCVEAQSSLNQLHASDALLRVNRGQLYESISTKLMAPLESRIAASKLDGGRLAEIAAIYDRQLAEFRTNYQVYEEAMSKTLQINCTNQPVAFYDSVADTRSKRAVVNDSTQALQATIQEYSGQFDEFSRKIQEANQ